VFFGFFVGGVPDLFASMGFVQVWGRVWGMRCLRLMGRSSSDSPAAVLFLCGLPAGLGESAPRFGSARTLLHEYHKDTTMSIVLTMFDEAAETRRMPDRVTRLYIAHIFRRGHTGGRSKQAGALR
jgi:hypothetical protein